MDLEWNSGGADGISLAEILQIGAVKFDRAARRITDTFNVYIHPRVHAEFNTGSKTLPQLQKSLDSTVTFAQAYSAFLKWAEGESVFAGWGAEDWQVLNANAAYYSLPQKVDTRMVDLQMAFSITMGAANPMALHKAVDFCHIPDCFDYHDALNDAMYTALVSEDIEESTLNIRLNGARCMELLSKSFAEPPRRRSAYLESINAVLNCGAMRNLKCPVCGVACTVWEWCSNDERRFYGLFRCKEHGRFICRLTITQHNGLFRGCSAVPEMDARELHYYQHAHQGKHYPCGIPAKRRRRRRKKQADLPVNAAEQTKQENMI